MEAIKPKVSKQISLSPLEERLAVMQKNQELFIGIPKERGFQDTRIALTPDSVKLLVNNGHKIYIETNAGLKANYTDFNYSEAGAEICKDINKIYEANIIIKASPITPGEIDLLKYNQTILSPMHLPKITKKFLERLQKKKVTSIAYELVKDEADTFPFVRTLSEIAGYSSILIASEYLSNMRDGRGILFGGITGVPCTKVVILGAGVVGEFATRAALGLGAEVKLFDNNIYKLMRLQNNIGQRVFTSIINPNTLKEELQNADVAIGAIHSETGRTSIFVTEEMVKNMKPGSIIIDVSIDQGGCFETSETTDHKNPTFTKHDVVHFCVPNIASRYSKTATKAISNILTPLLLKMGHFNNIDSLLYANQGLRNGVFVFKGMLTNKYLGERFNMKSTNLDLLMAANI